MRAAVVREKGGPFLIENLTIDEPRDDEVLVQMRAVGICHSDISCRDQVFPARLPQVFGHEGAGIVKRVGAKVQRLKKGDHVLLSFDSCGQCPNCSDSQPAYCDNFDLLNANGKRRDGSSALSGVQGRVHGHFFGQSSFAEYAIVRQSNAIAIDKTIDFALAAPFGCAVQTGAGCVMNTLQAQPGQSMLVIGAGGVGLSAIMAAKLLGCDPVIAVDLHAVRLELSKQLGATHVINAGTDNVVEAVRRICPRGVDFSLECSGSASVQELSVQVLNNRGTCALLGVPGLGARFDVACYLLNSGRTVKGVVAGDSHPQAFLPELLALHKAGHMPVNQWISRYPFAQINQAADDLVRGIAVKPVLVFDNWKPGDYVINPRK